MPIKVRKPSHSESAPAPLSGEEKQYRASARLKPAAGRRLEMPDDLRARLESRTGYDMATLLELPLYQINLSQVVDKYIGETEKRLEDIFDTAEKSNTILFFDEADAIFGKRSEVSDAKDKYANTEVSYILQRIEQYEGIVILATNYKKNIDEAFMRRMRYLIEFTLPGPALREEIWRSAFAAEVPLDHVDFAYLARQFELSGGAIKNIVLNAAFSAAREGSAVGMRLGTVKFCLTHCNFLLKFRKWSLGLILAICTLKIKWMQPPQRRVCAPAAAA